MLNPQPILLAVLALLAFVAGALDYGPFNDPRLASAVLMVHVATSVALIVAWCLVDARQRAYPTTIAFKIALVCLTVIALPY